MADRLLLCMEEKNRHYETKTKLANNDFSTRDYYNISLGAKKDT